MKTKFIKLFLITVLPIVMVISLIKSINASPGGKAQYTYAPGELTCRGCHDDYPLNTTNAGMVYITGTPITTGTYVGGQTYNMSITIAAGSLTTGGRCYGFGIEVLRDVSPFQNGGTLNVTDATNTRMYNPTVYGVVRKNLAQANDGGTVSTGSRTLNFSWTAPATGTGNVIFHVTGLVGNNNGSASGDYVIVKKYKITG